MKAIKFFCLWLVNFGLVYAWLGLGYQGAFNVLRVMMTVTTVFFSLAMFADDADLAKPSGSSWLLRNIGRIFTLLIGAIFIWTGHMLIGAFYLCAYALLLVRVQVARENLKKSPGVA